MVRLTNKERMALERKLKKQLMSQKGRGVLGDLAKIVAPILIKEGAKLGAELIKKKRKKRKTQKRSRLSSAIKRSSSTRKPRKTRRKRGAGLHPAGSIRLSGKGFFPAGSVRRVIDKPVPRRIVQTGGALAPAGTIRVARRTTPSLPNRPQLKIQTRK